jgi:hypothetical protein
VPIERVFVIKVGTGRDWIATGLAAIERSEVLPGRDT